MQKTTIIRIISDAFIFIFAAVGLWWVIFPVGVFGAWYYRKFYELPLAGFILDIIYSTSRSRIFGFQYIYTLIASVIFLFVVIIKTRVRKEVWQKTF